jgi:amino acid transporter
MRRDPSTFKEEELPTRWEPLLNESFDTTSNKLHSHLKQGLNAFMSFSFCYSSIAVITSLCLVINFGLETGGPVAMTWGWLLASFFTLCTVSSMAEICSVYPSAGSVYYWTGMLAPRREYSAGLSYVCAWFNLMGNVACDASFAFGLSQVISSSVQLYTGGERALNVHTQVALSVLALVLWAVKNRMRLDQQGWFGNASAVYQMVSTLVMTLIIVVASERLSPTSFVFTQYNNSTGFVDAPWTTVYILMIGGFLTSLYGLSGYESGATLSEETANAETAAPRGMIEAVIASIVTGGVFIVGLLYACQGDIQRVLQGPTDQAVVNIFSMTFLND